MMINIQKSIQLHTEIYFQAKIYDGYSLCSQWMGYDIDVSYFMIQ